MSAETGAISDSPAIRALGLIKHYGATVAVAGVDLEIPRGQFFGLLGPNGSGKTSLVHMLSTLIRPRSGEAWVAGLQVRTQQLAIRRSIGVVFQEPALDRALSVVQNLTFAGRLNNLTRAEIRKRSDELLALFGLEETRNRPAGALSGGMRRALDIARGLIHRPQILFLDEPTIGLDLPSRRAIWRYISSIRASCGMTVFLTTHYLEEALDCDAVSFLSGGRIVRSGRPGDLIEQLGRTIVEVETDRPAELAARFAASLGESLIEGDCVQFRCSEEAHELGGLQRQFAGCAQAVRFRKPNLNDVFLWVTRAPSICNRAA